MIRKILIYPNSILRSRSNDVNVIQLKAGAYDQLVNDMFETMYEAGGIGLSAIQVGEPVSLFIMETDGKEHVFFNPVINHYNESHTSLKNEGCLSFPGMIEEISRHEEVSISYFDRLGNPQVGNFKGIQAQVIQHEAEHLEGGLFYDGMAATKRARFLKEYDNLRKQK